MITLYNTLTRKKEPIKKEVIGFYSCGPTVYDFAHIGNFRAYIVADLLKRYLLYRGISVKHVMNLTDVDDKTIRNSKSAGMSLKDFTEKYSKHFFEDLDILNIVRADIYPRATEFIQQMISLIEKLLKKGIAYKAQDGIYYSIGKFPEYGKFAHLKTADLKTGARINSDEYDKQSANDFALWKFWSDKDGDVVWDSPFGKGRPGWHIECSAMSMELLGESFDIHSGGVDLIFPHHQNEIAQSEGASGKQFVSLWVHNEHLIVDGKKMSKSLGNFYTLRDLTDKGYSPIAIRYLLFSVHYRQQLNFTLESLKAANTAVEKINDFYRRIKDFEQKREIKSLSTSIIDAINFLKNTFNSSMDDDLGISEALSSIHEFMNSVNSSEENLTGMDAKKIIEIMDRIDSVLGIITDFNIPLEPELEKILLEREKARKYKDYSKSDKLRELLLSKGIKIDDTNDGFRWKRIKNL